MQNKLRTFRFYILKKVTHTCKKINAILYRSQRSFTNVSGKSTVQLTTSGKETVAACILKSSTSTSSETYGLNPCKIHVKEFISRTVADQINLSQPVH